MYLNETQTKILYPEYENVQSVEDYIFNNSKFRVEISKRQYDGKYNVWRPYIEFADDGAFSIYWEVIHVDDTEQGANEFVREFWQKRA